MCRIWRHFQTWPVTFLRINHVKNLTDLYQMASIASRSGFAMILYSKKSMTTLVNTVRIPKCWRNSLPKFVWFNIIVCFMTKHNARFGHFEQLIILTSWPDWKSIWTPRHPSKEWIGTSKNKKFSFKNKNYKYFVSTSLLIRILFLYCS